MVFGLYREEDDAIEPQVVVTRKHSYWLFLKKRHKIFICENIYRDVFTLEMTKWPTPHPATGLDEPVWLDIILSSAYPVNYKKDKLGFYILVYGPA